MHLSSHRLQFESLVCLVNVLLYPATFQVVSDTEQAEEPYEEPYSHCSENED